MTVSVLVSVSSSKALSKKEIETEIVMGHGLGLSLAFFLEGKLHDDKHLGCIVQKDIRQI